MIMWGDNGDEDGETRLSRKSILQPNSTIKESTLQILKFFGSFCLQWALQQKLELLVSIPLFNNNVGLFCFQYTWLRS
jgi:hypothetical protein